MKGEASHLCASCTPAPCPGLPSNCRRQKKKGEFKGPSKARQGTYGSFKEFLSPGLRRLSRTINAFAIFVLLFFFYSTHCLVQSDVFSANAIARWSTSIQTFLLYAIMFWWLSTISDWKRSRREAIEYDSMLGNAELWQPRHQADTFDWSSWSCFEERP